MDIVINLANRPFRDLRPALKRMRYAMIALLSAAIALGVLSHFVHRQAGAASARLNALEHEVADIAGEQQGYQAMMHRPDHQALLRQINSLNQLFDAKTLSWTSALQDIQAVLPGSVQVTSIEPAVSNDRQITLHIRVAGPRDKCIEFVKNLETSSKYYSPRIAGESADTAPGANLKAQAAGHANSTSLDLFVGYDSDSSGASQPADGEDSGNDEMTHAAMLTDSSQDRGVPAARARALVRP